MRNVENQRTRIVVAFVALNIVDDVLSGVGNVIGSVAGTFKGMSMSVRFAQYDLGRKYADLTDGDFGRVIGCPGHYQGECVHTAPDPEEGDGD